MDKDLCSSGASADFPGDYLKMAAVYLPHRSDGMTGAGANANGEQVER
jgi:hypothetical protein